MGDSKVNHIVGISEMKVSNIKDDVLITYSLGSCMGLTLWDKECFIGGLVHCMLPLSKIDPVKAKTNPCMFTDTGVLTLLQALYDLGAKRKNLIAKVAGCASLLDQKRFFKIGERNYAVLRKILWKNNILIENEDVGGSKSRTMFLSIATGITSIKSGSQVVEL
jgi:chemotaxis protein CheD